MSLKDRITEDMKAAMRAKEAERLGTIRMLLAAIKQREVDERIVLDDNAVVAIVELSGLSVGNSIPAEPPAGVPEERIVERSEPATTVPVGLQPVPADEENTRLYPFGVPRTQRVQGAPPGAPIYSVGLRPFH